MTTMTEWRVADADTRYPRNILVCTMPVIDWEYDDDGNEPRRPQPPRPCGAEMHVHFEGYVSIGPDMFINAGADFGGWADTTAWALECEEGHTHATSPSGGRDDADPFDTAVYAPPPPTAT